MLLELCDLTVHYGKANALDGISMHVDQGEVVTVVGANGAGKTTLLRVISGLKTATSGEVRFQGERIHGITPHRISRLGIMHVPANRMIVSTMTVLENLQLGAHSRRDRRGILKDLEDLFQTFPILKDKRSQLGGQLSGGQQQMLAFARALMAKPRLLLLDEPSTGLAPIMVQEVGRQISDISQRLGVSILLVEQNARMALRLADRAYILELGKTVLAGPAKELARDERIRRSYLGC